MNDAGRVRLRQRVGDLDGILQRFIEPQPLAPDQLVERLARHVLHGDELHAVRIRDVVDVNDIGMVQSGSRLCLLHEAALPFRVGQSFGGEDFQCDEPVQVGVPGLLHHAHAALAELFDDLILR